MFSIILIGGTGFIFLFLYDLCQKYKQKTFALIFSIIGYTAIFSSMLFLLFSFKPKFEPMFSFILKAVMAVIFFLLLLYSLFFEIPLKNTIVGRKIRIARSEGTYGIVRHPGFLWFFFLNLSLILIYREIHFTIISASLVTMDFLLVLIEDHFIFPHIFSNYKDYKKEVPFLIPRMRRSS